MVVLLTLIAISAVGLGGFIGIISFILVKLAMLDCRAPKFEITEMKGKIVVVTGGNTGIGFAECQFFAKQEATVIMACRNNYKANIAKERILKRYPNAIIETMHIDMASFKTIHEFSGMFKAKYPHVDLLVNSAGIMVTRESAAKTFDGLDVTMGTNFFGPFLLTGLLLPHMAEKGRIVNVSSFLHFIASKDFVDRPPEVYQNRHWIAYGNAKAALLMFTYQLNKRLLSAVGERRDIVCLAAHPGYTATGLQHQHLPFAGLLNTLYGMKPHQGALPIIRAAVDPTVQASVHDYLGPRFVICGAPVLQTTCKGTWNPETQAKLWDEAVRITGENYNGI